MKNNLKTVGSTLVAKYENIDTLNAHKLTNVHKEKKINISGYYADRYDITATSVCQFLYAQIHELLYCHCI